MAKILNLKYAFTFLKRSKININVFVKSLVMAFVVLLFLMMKSYFKLKYSSCVHYKFRTGIVENKMIFVIRRFNTKDIQENETQLRFTSLPLPTRYNYSNAFHNNQVKNLKQHFNTASI